MISLSRRNVTVSCATALQVWQSELAQWDSERTASRSTSHFDTPRTRRGAAARADHRRRCQWAAPSESSESSESCHPQHGRPDAGPARLSSRQCMRPAWPREAGRVGRCASPAVSESWRAIMSQTARPARHSHATVSHSLAPGTACLNVTCVQGENGKSISTIDSAQATKAHDADTDSDLAHPPDGKHPSARHAAPAMLLRSATGRRAAGHVVAHSVPSDSE